MVERNEDVLKAWDDRGWHQYNHGFSVVSGPDFKVSFCKDCGCSSSDHVPLVEYVTRRLKGKPVEPVFQFGFTGFKEV